MIHVLNVSREVMTCELRLLYFFQMLIQFLSKVIHVGITFLYAHQHTFLSFLFDLTLWKVNVTESKYLQEDRMNERLQILYIIIYYIIVTTDQNPKYLRL